MNQTVIDQLAARIASDPAYLKALMPRMNKYMKQNPFTPKLHKKQAIFLMFNGLECLFGGGKAGAKSSGILMSALQYCDMPNYGALILRRELPQLYKSNALIPRAQEWLSGTDAVWKEQQRKFVFPSGATLEFGHMEHAHDKHIYDGSEYSYIAFDQVEQFEEEMYLHAFSLVRRTESNKHIPIRIRATANPVGKHVDWVKRRFVDSPIPGERVFIPSLLTDNPYLDQAEYQRTLAYLPKHIREALEEGRWDAEALGAVFNKSWFKLTDSTPANNEFIHRVRWWDLAATTSAQNADADYTAGALLGITADGTVWVLDVSRVQASAADVENLILNMAKIDGRDVTIWMNQDPGQAGKAQANHYTDLLRGYDFHTEPATGPKLTAWRPFAAYCENGRVMVARRKWTDALLDEMCRVTGTNKNEHDDQTDAVTRSFLKLEMPTAVRVGMDMMRREDYDSFNPNIFRDTD